MIGEQGLLRRDRQRRLEGRRGRLRGCARQREVAPGRRRKETSVSAQSERIRRQAEAYRGEGVNVMNYDKHFCRFRTNFHRKIWRLD
jgi:hypothetical protein